MPLEVVSTDGRTFRYREYVLQTLGPRDVRVRVEFAAPKHGTELHSLSGNPHHRKRWDETLRIYLPLPKPLPLTERPVGNMVVGSVTGVGSGATRFSPGDRVFGYGPIREEHQLSEDSWRPLGSLSDTDAVCSDPAHVALVAVRDGNVRIGDAVAVFGMGAIGLMTVQIAARSGATKVIAVDPIECRRSTSGELGADLLVDPSAEDAGLRIKRATDSHGVDVAIETSGSAAALHESIRAIRQCGTIVHVPYGPKDASTLHLDEEFHVNRPTIIGSQAVWQNPDRSYPLWDEERARVTAIDLFRRGMVTSEGIVTPIVGFRDAAQALSDSLGAPDRAIKIGVRFP
ncbi:MAG: zinc-binding alcohol dehydrogenase [Chloroflexota bacterium]|nr:zinc-binding alcohol dehydrogenase [bacterium]MDE2766940.1 zinc-binding alcohol dehydrogenase [Chloroflexota bacterium]MDE2898380.1 zinc-binding alcohol dehydrogenase [Chloroflexota bacterium]